MTIDLLHCMVLAIEVKEARAIRLETIKRMEMSIEELKKQVKEAEESKEVMNFNQETPQPTKIRVEDKSKNKYDLVELFSPPRMTGMTGKFGLKGGWSIDDRAEDPVTKRTYDLRNKKDQNEVLRMIRRDKPLVITVSPPCTLFSIANQGPLDKKELAGAIEMMKFATEVCDLQSREGRYYVFEQPQGSRAWELAAVKALMTKRDSWVTTMHQCMYGLKTRDTQGEASAYKPTTTVTNHEALAEGTLPKMPGGASACPFGGQDGLHQSRTVS